MIFGLQALLALAFTLLSHAASARHDPVFAACALAVLSVLLLLGPLSRGRIGGWIGLVVAVGIIALLWRADLTLVPLLLVPTALMSLVATWFARSLRTGRVPLITKIVAAIDRTLPDALVPALRDYTRGLTRAWACLLGALALLNLFLAVVAVPDGLLAQFGIAAPLTVTRTQWSWFANVCNYGIIGGFFVLEYHLRKRRFPGRYRNFADFARRLAGLGPAFWRDFLH